jgi:hypothetical protein
MSLVDQIEQEQVVVGAARDDAVAAICRQRAIARALLDLTCAGRP